MSNLWSRAKSRSNGAATLRRMCRSYSDTEQPAASREHGLRETDQERNRLSAQEQLASKAGEQFLECGPVAVDHRNAAAQSLLASRRSALGGQASTPLAAIASNRPPIRSQLPGARPQQWVD